MGIPTFLWTKIKLTIRAQCGLTMRRGAYLAWRRRGSLAPRDLAWPTRSTIDSSASFLSSPFSSSASSSWTSREDERTAFESTVGNTRLVRLKGPSEITGCHIFGKAEYENPGIFCRSLYIVPFHAFYLCYMTPFPFLVTR